MRLYRLTNRHDPTDAFSGEGARRVAGRWNPVGVRIVYTSSSASLAVIETLVHGETENLAAFTSLYSVDVPDHLIETPPLASLPPDWNHPKRSDHARAYGQEWARSQRSLALAVPSVIVPHELNVLLNPTHPAFTALTIRPPSPFTFDQRLLTTQPPARRRKSRRK